MKRLMTVTKEAGDFDKGESLIGKKEVSAAQGETKLCVLPQSLLRRLLH